MGDARPSRDPANGDAFRTALDTANQRSEGAERPSSRPASTDEAAPSDEGEIDAESESPADATMRADALSMLLTWLVPTPLTPTETTVIPAGTGEVPAAGPVGAVGLGAAIGSQATLTDVLSAAQDAAAALGSETGATPVSAFAVSQADAMLAQAIPPAEGGIPLIGMTATPDDAPDLSALAAAQAAAQASAATDETRAAAGSATTAAATSTPTSVASLAADFGAQVIATNAPAGQAAPVEDAQAPTTGSTAQAAGAGTTAGIQLPGQAVAATGASSQASTGTFGEGLDAGTEAVTTARAGQNGAESPTEIAASAFSTTINSLSQTQDADAVQASATSGPPVASQIAEGALMAARRIGQSVEMVLQPEGLGSVTLPVTAERAGLGVHIAVDNPQTREMVQASWPQLQQALEQRGLTVQSLMLDLSSGRDNGEAFQAFQQFNGQQQFSGQQTRGGSVVSATDESTPMQSSVATPSRVGYRI